MHLLHGLKRGTQVHNVGAIDCAYRRQALPENILEVAAFFSLREKEMDRETEIDIDMDRRR